MENPFIQREKRQAISVKLDVKTLHLLKVLGDVSDVTKTGLLEMALWAAFDSGLLTDKKTQTLVKKEFEKKYPGVFER